MVGRLIGGDGAADALGRDLEITPDGDGRQHILQIVGADQTGFHHVHLALLFPVEGQKRIAADHMADGKGPVMLPVGNLFQSVGYAHQVFVVLIDEHRPAGMAEVVVELSFRMQHTFERAETFQMGTADVGNQAVVGRRDMYQLFDVARMAGTHLHDSHLVVGRQAEQREGHPDLVVQVAFRGKDIEFRGEDRRQQFLRCGLAIGAGHPDNRQSQCFAMAMGQLLQRSECVVHQNRAFASLTGRVVYNSISSPRIQGFGCILISIKAFPFQGKEKRTPRAVPAIGRHLPMMEE